MSDDAGHQWSVRFEDSRLSAERPELGAVLLTGRGKSSSTLGQGARQMLHLRALSEGERILDVDAEVADCALDLRMAEQNLQGA